MKKIFILSLIIASVVSLSSCKKDYTCTCTSSGSTSYSSISTIHGSKSSAKTECANKSDATTNTVCQISSY